MFNKNRPNGYVILQKEDLVAFTNNGQRSGSLERYESNVHSIVTSLSVMKRLSPVGQCRVTNGGGYLLNVYNTKHLPGNAHP